MPGSPGGPVDDFYSSPVRRSTFVPVAAQGNPGDQRPKHQYRSSLPAMVKLAVAAVVVGGVAYWGVPPAVSAVQDAETRSLTSDLGAIAEAEITYHRTHGYFTDSLIDIAGETSVNQVQVITADANRLCLKATPLLRQAPLYYAPQTGITTASCE